MINLLPEDKKQELMRVYALRVTLTGLSALLLIEIAMLTAFVPSYLSARGDRDLAQAELATLKERGTGDVTTEQEIAALVSDISLMTPTQETITWSAVAKKIEHLSIPGVAITSLAYAKNDKEKRIQVRGVAKDRDIFFAFRGRLSADPAFTKVDMPSSAFVKDKDIEFTAIMTLRDNAKL